jgi:hypothetical protein
MNKANTLNKVVSDITYKAKCKECDYEGPTRKDEEQANEDALKHQIAKRHQVVVLETQSS